MLLNPWETDGDYGKIVKTADCCATRKSGSALDEVAVRGADRVTVNQNGSELICHATLGGLNT